MGSCFKGILKSKNSYDVCDPCHMYSANVARYTEVRRNNNWSELYAPTTVVNTDKDGVNRTPIDSAVCPITNSDDNSSPITCNETVITNNNSTDSSLDINGADCLAERCDSLEDLPASLIQDMADDVKKTTEVNDLETDSVLDTWDSQPNAHIQVQLQQDMEAITISNGSNEAEIPNIETVVIAEESNGILHRKDENSHTERSTYSVRFAEPVRDSDDSSDNDTANEDCHSDVSYDDSSDILPNGTRS